ncbi:hypothetical protein [Methylorubrum podarium]|jgi:hypothetical protein|uniref:Uncharacterized protein n=1 Tax=Methylorubrum podarium TaxID=200476 RepID=A0ABV1QV69_9HYPH|nr:hypothetical protein [Methylorubrum podarium]MDV2985504.1 hypothetical protein [Methylobacteriaceae bacterium AG10]GJE72514.1 hypothetical protein CHKEEEPN_4071 [Methylorubrum podarium]
MRALNVFLAAFAVATAAFWFSVLSYPPQTRAAPSAIADSWPVKPKATPPIADDYDPEF